MELFEVIRRDHHVHGRSVRWIARHRHVHRRTVRQALASAVPPARRVPVREAPVLTAALQAVVDAWLQADRHAPRKQRHTARRIHARLVSEHGFAGAESTVRRYVGRRRRELGLNTQAYVPLATLPGEEAEVDWYEATVSLVGRGLVVLQFFLMRACHSGREFHMAFERATQQAFLEGHVAAFAHFGGVFARVRYDNLSSAVQRVLRGRRREETARFVALRSHYLFESAFCRPGVVGAPEKGGVEGGLGRFRRHHLVPVPQMADLEALNAHLRACCVADEARRVGERTLSVAEVWAEEAPRLRALPGEPFDCDEVSTHRVDAKARVCVRTNRYSVPVRLVGRRVEVRLGAARVDVVHEGRRVARHRRRYGRHGESLELDHYLELLAHKPGAMPRARPLAQARAAGRWPEAYDRLWAAMRERHGEAEGTRQLLEVLHLHRSCPARAVLDGVEHALTLGLSDAGSVATLVRRAGQADARPPVLDHELGALAGYGHARAGALDAYDALYRAAEVSP